MNNLRIARENFWQWRDEAPPLFRAHWEEIALYREEVPLDPDYEKLLELERIGVLHAFTVRRKDDDALCGYSGYLVLPHIHYKSTIVAMNDVIYLDPKYRRGTTAARLVRFCESYLSSTIGARRFTYHVKIAHDFGPLLERMGYAREETIFGKLV